MTCFAEWQPIYAAHGLATFPVRIEDGVKKPMARNYLHAGRRYSAQLARQFPNADAFGFALGARTKITVLDCDSNDDRVLADAMARHGKTPLIVRSGSGNYQAWYRHNGERRHIRPDPRLPVDILGGGFVVAPPSRGTKSAYQIIGGKLEDLARLPPLQNFVPETKAEEVTTGRRNNALWMHCMRQCRACDDFVALLDVAETFNSRSLAPPLEANEVLKVAQSAWGYTQRGQNWIGAQHNDFDSASFPPSALSSDPFLYTLLCWLRDHDGCGRTLMIADALADILRWSKHQLRETRRRAVEGGWVVLVEPPTRTRAARFAWGPSASCHSLCNPEVMPDEAEAGAKGGRGSVYSQVWNPEAIHGGVIGHAEVAA